MEKVADKQGELLKAWDDSGNYFGLFPRKEVHSKGLWHREASCIILSKKNRLLIIKRSYDKSSYPAAWGLIAGHVVGNENPKVAVLEEAEEEVFLPLLAERKNLNDEHCICKDMKNEREDNKALVTCYWLKPSVLKMDMMQFQEEEVEVFQWITVGDFKKMVKRQDPQESIFKDNLYYNSIISYLENLLQNKKTSIKQDNFINSNEVIKWC